MGSREAATPGEHPSRRLRARRNAIGFPRREDRPGLRGGRTQKPSEEGVHMTFHQRRKLMMVVLAAALVVSATAASRASAIIKQLPDHRVVSSEPLRNPAAAAAATAAAPTPPVIAPVNQEFNGGPVRHSTPNACVLARAQ